MPGKLVSKPRLNYRRSAGPRRITIRRGPRHPGQSPTPRHPGTHSQGRRPGQHPAPPQPDPGRGLTASPADRADPGHPRYRKRGVPSAVVLAHHDRRRERSQIRRAARLGRDRPARAIPRLTVDHRDPTPLYVQLAALIRAEISSGELSKDDPVPSESYLQQTHGVSRVTVRKAIEVLRNENLVYTLPQRGTFVR